MRYEKEVFTKIVKESYSISEIMDKIGVSKYSGNRKTIKKYIKKYEIDCSHFSRSTFISRETYLKKTLNEILVENSTYPTAHLKERLYKEGYKEKCCELCNQNEIWNGRKMSLILDHKNGINDDHRIENLQIVCPNCNATLDTFSGKNKKKALANLCQCGCVINKISKRCTKCSNFLKRKVERPDIKILLNEVENIGYVQTGLKYGVSDNTIRKWLKK